MAAAGPEELRLFDLASLALSVDSLAMTLSVVAFSERARDAYKTGIYGNTMTFNPRAARVGTAALRAMTPARRANVVERGKELLSALEDLVRR